ncbi:SPOR domain-containing protein [Hymenobacter aerilatus]|uniref:SPOR domain-containing protein n=1 Tax=Hymenobacter aerilatus TaxID=2932251 RepID=A0A8T9T049_9BACT|nr:SPOR domain-containing protein [Hymenobacter aerilatus]UOR05399.1 SPOR domain-containing protein [Hymenobacter aerilatus]
MMKRLFRNVFLLPTLFAVAACATNSPSGPTASRPDTTRRTPSEDVSKYRPVFEAPVTAAATTPAPVPKKPVVPTNQVNAQIEQRLRDQAAANLNVKYAQGYRILAYAGLERDQAMAVRRAIISRYPEETDYLTFKQPVYRLYIGDYLTRLEAEQALLRLKPLAPKAELQVAQVLLSKAGQ